MGAGTLSNVVDFNEWLGTLPHEHKLVIAGNHDWAFQEAKPFALEALSNATYLEDCGVEIGGLLFWGSPWTPTFMEWAFMRDRGRPINEYWKRIPAKTDVLITHGPPSGIADEVDTGLGIEKVGCADLMRRIEQLSLKAHIFGHIHEGYGTYHRSETRFVNASICTESYKPINAPVVVDL